MTAPTTYHDVASTVQLNDAGSLFMNKKFWVAQRVPSRNHFVNDIRANGGEIVRLESQADYLIADHAKRDCAPGSISYKFIEDSIKQGEIVEPEDYLCEVLVGEAREVGAIDRREKGTRTEFTAEEDRAIYKWVHDRKMAGGAIAGNKIYREFGARHPRHPWQSWRHRYVKKLRDRLPSSFGLLDDEPIVDNTPTPAPNFLSKSRQLSSRARVTEQLDVTDESRRSPVSKPGQQPIALKSNHLSNVSDQGSKTKPRGGELKFEFYVAHGTSNNTNGVKRVHESSIPQEDSEPEVISRPLKRARSTDRPSAISATIEQEDSPAQSSSGSDAFHEASSVEGKEDAQRTPHDRAISVVLDCLPSSDPAPRATRETVNNLDTQAILYLPTPHEIEPTIHVGRHSRLQDWMSDRLSPSRDPGSDSTTHTMEEFRRSLCEVDDTEYLELPHHDLDHQSVSDVLSEASGEELGDPDVPLEAHEFDEFFEECHAQGFNNEMIVKALKRTRLRPKLTMKVLDAWKIGQPLPNRRGIWSLEDDEVVESGDVTAFAILENKHTMDGWGGITERMIFLDAQRDDYLGT